MTGEDRLERKPRLFLSYGRKDATALALRLRDSLSERFDVWQDSERIRAGYRWDEEVAAAIESADAFLALLTPHAVRSAVDSDDGRTSVCLDEIAHARSRETPIVPVKAEHCGVPFHIQRLHYLDGRDWSAADARYDALLRKIEEALANVLSGKPHPLRDWAGLPEPLDFGAFLAERHAHFSGRDHVFDALTTWLAAEGPGVLLITGSPGAGKSAIVADLVHRNPEGAVLAHHVCQWDTPTTLESARFVSSVAAQIADALPEYAAMIEDEALRKRLRPDALRKDAASGFEFCVLAPLLRCVPPAAPRLLVIDALDEGIRQAETTTILDLLASRLGRFPLWLRIAATSRADRRITDRLGAMRVIDLDAAEIENRDDVAVYIARRLGTPAPRRKPRDRAQGLDAVSAEIARIADGSFLVARLLIDVLREPEAKAGKLEGMPPGLASAFTVYFDRVFEARNLDADAIRPLLEALVTAQEAVSRSDLSLATGLHPKAALPPLLEALAPFFPYRAGGYSSFHQSLSQWLTAWNEATDQAAAGTYHADPEAGHTRWADRAWSGVTGDPAEAGNYALRHLPLHLAEAGQRDRLWQLMRDDGYVGHLMRRFPTEPALPIGIVRHAIAQAFRSGDVPRLLRALWHEAPRLVSLARGETPLRALDGGDLERGLRLADLAEPQARALHHVILAWALSDDERIDDAARVLERLTDSDPVGLEGEEATCAIIAIGHIADAGVALKDNLLVSVFRLTEPRRQLDLGLILEPLWTTGRRHLARRIAALSAYPDFNGAGLVAREAIEQADAGNFGAAYEIFNTMQGFDRRRGRHGESAITEAHPAAVIGIAVAHAQRNDDANALKLLAYLHPLDWGRAIAAIGEAMARSGRPDDAKRHFSETSKQIEALSREAPGHTVDGWWSELACAQARSGFIEEVTHTLARLDPGPDRDRGLAALAGALTASGDDDEAIAALAEIEDDGRQGVSEMAVRIAADRGSETALAVLDRLRPERHVREGILREMAVHLAGLGRFDEAHELADRMRSSWDRGRANQKIAIAEARAGHLARAIGTANACESWRRIRTRLGIGAVLAEQGQGRRAREEISNALMLEEDDHADRRDDFLRALLARLADAGAAGSTEAVADKVAGPFEKVLARATLARARHQSGATETAKADWEALRAHAPKTPKGGKILVWCLAQDQLDCGEIDLAMANVAWLEEAGSEGFYLSEIAGQAAERGYRDLAIDTMARAATAIAGSDREIYRRLSGLLQAVRFLAQSGALACALGFARGEETEIGRGALLAAVAQVLAETGDDEAAGSLIDASGALLQPVAELERELNGMFFSAPRDKDVEARARWEAGLEQVKSRLEDFRPAKTVDSVDYATAIKEAELARARALARLGRTDEARVVTGNETTRPFRADVLVSAAEGCADAGRPEDALSFLDPALEALSKSDAIDAKRLRNVSAGFLRIGRRDRAADCFAVSPDAGISATILTDLAQAAHRDGDAEAARRHFAEAFGAAMAIGHGGDRSKALTALATAQIGCGYPEAALGTARAIAEDRATALHRLFRTFVAQGLRSQAQDILLLSASDSSAARKVATEIVAAFPDRLQEIADWARDEL